MYISFLPSLILQWGTITSIEVGNNHPDTKISELINALSQSVIQTKATQLEG